MTEEVTEKTLAEILINYAREYPYLFSCQVLELHKGLTVDQVRAYCEEVIRKYEQEHE